MFRRLIRRLKMLIAVFCTVLLALFAFDNRAFIEISLFPLPYEIELPKFLLVIFFFGIGLLVGAIVMSLKLGRALRFYHKEHERSMALENEVKSLKSERSSFKQTPANI